MYHSLLVVTSGCPVLDMVTAASALSNLVMSRASCVRYSPRWLVSTSLSRHPISATTSNTTPNVAARTVGTHEGCKWESDEHKNEVRHTYARALFGGGGAFWGLLFLAGWGWYFASVRNPVQELQAWLGICFGVCFKNSMRWECFCLHMSSERACVGHFSALQCAQDPMEKVVSMRLSVTL